MSRKPVVAPGGNYHHGNLRQALIDAALGLAAEGGLEKVTMREAARRAGVSSGAPFRHFPDRTALMTAVAEEAMSRLRAAMAAAAIDKIDPAAALRAMGQAYLGWARDNPTHFQIISSRRQIDFAGSASLGADNQALQDMMDQILLQALPGRDPRLTRLMTRALTYGLARMQVDGQFPSWQVSEGEAEAAMLAVLDLFIDLIVPVRPASS